MSNSRSLEQQRDPRFNSFWAVYARRRRSIRSSSLGLPRADSMERLQVSPSASPPQSQLRLPSGAGQIKSGRYTVPSQARPVASRRARASEDPLQRAPSRSRGGAECRDEHPQDSYRITLVALLQSRMWSRVNHGLPPRPSSFRSVGADIRRPLLASANTFHTLDDRALTTSLTMAYTAEE